jgi:hypothetical protein
MLLLQIELLATYGHQSVTGRISKKTPTEWVRRPVITAAASCQDDPSGCFSHPEHMLKTNPKSKAALSSQSASESDSWACYAHVAEFFAEKRPCDYNPWLGYKCPVVFRLTTSGEVEQWKKSGKGQWRKVLPTDKKGNDLYWDAYLKKMRFEVNVTFGVAGVNSDFTRGDPWPCLANSVAPFESQSTLFQNDVLQQLVRSVKLVDTPWEARDSVPFWRGMVWPPGNAPAECHSLAGVLTALNSTSLGRQRGSRLRAITLSALHPKLLNAKPVRSTAPVWNAMRSLTTWLNCSTELTPLEKMAQHNVPAEQYAAMGKVALVLRGKGAAFRLDNHLQVGTAVVLEDDEWQLWYTPHLAPNVHYIPLAMGALNLTAVLKWVAHNPAEVRAIANRGRQFYERNLAPAAVERCLRHLFTVTQQFVGDGETRFMAEISPDTLDMTSTQKPLRAECSLSNCTCQRL